MYKIRLGINSYVHKTQRDLHIKNKMTKINKIQIININLMCWMMFLAKMKLLWVNERGPAGRSLDSEFRLLFALQRLHPAACFCLNH